MDSRRRSVARVSERPGIPLQVMLLVAALLVAARLVACVATRHSGMLPLRSAFLLVASLYRVLIVSSLPHRYLTFVAQNWRRPRLTMTLEIGGNRAEQNPWSVSERDVARRKRDVARRVRK